MRKCSPVAKTPKSLFLLQFPVWPGWIVIWALKPQAGWWKSVKLGKLRENHRRLERVGLLDEQPSTLFYAVSNPPETRGWKRWQEIKVELEIIFFAFFPKENIFQTPFVLCSDGSDEKRKNSSCTNRCYSTNQCMSDFFKTLLAAVQLFGTQNPDVFPFLAFPCKTQ